MLQKIDIHVTDHCNLNCRSCTHFSPLALEFYLDIDDFEKDIKRMSELTKGEIGSIFLLGGEPLLHPELIDFFLLQGMLFLIQILLLLQTEFCLQANLNASGKH